MENHLFKAKIVGVELTNKEIRLAQITSNKANQWILEKFYIHKVDLPDDASVLDNADKMGEELSLAIQNLKLQPQMLHRYTCYKCDY